LADIIPFDDNLPDDEFAPPMAGSPSCGERRVDALTVVQLSDRDLAQLLAALRNWQIDALNEDLADAFVDHFEEHEPLTDDEIDALCERLNFADGQVVKGAAY